MSHGLQQHSRGAEMVSAAKRESSTTKNMTSPDEILAMFPPGLRYRFLDEIQEIDSSHVVAGYRFRDDEFFYPGHFPEQQITPGTILLEAMCQCGVAAQSYYLLAQEMSLAQAREFRVLFTGAEAEWFEPVGPGTTISIRSQLTAWRRRRVRARVQVFDERSLLVAESRVAGMCVLLTPQSGRDATPKLDAEQFEPVHHYHGGTNNESR